MGANCYGKRFDGLGERRRWLVAKSGCLLGVYYFFVIGLQARDLCSNTFYSALFCTNSYNFVQQTLLRPRVWRRVVLVGSR